MTPVNTSPDPGVNTSQFDVSSNSRQALPTTTNISGAERYLRAS